MLKMQFVILILQILMGAVFLLNHLAEEKVDVSHVGKRVTGLEIVGMVIEEVVVVVVAIRELQTEGIPEVVSIAVNWVIFHEIVETPVGPEEEVEEVVDIVIDIIRIVGVVVVDLLHLVKGKDGLDLIQDLQEGEATRQQTAKVQNVEAIASHLHDLRIVPVRLRSLLAKAVHHLEHRNLLIDLEINPAQLLPRRDLLLHLGKTVLPNQVVEGQKMLEEKKEVRINKIKREVLL